MTSSTNTRLVPTRQLPARAATGKPARKLRRGQSLVEFAVVAFVVYMLLAAILTFGHALYVAQGLQSAVEVGAREISRTPLPANITLDNPADDPEPGALYQDDVRGAIFDEAYLVIDLAALYGGDPSADFFQDAVPQMPLLNQQLATLMIVDRPDTNGDGTPDAWLLRYPGALLDRTEAITPPSGTAYPDWVATEYAVGIPVVTDRTGGSETIRWAAVVEEIDTEVTPGDNTGPNPDPFKLVQDDPGNIDHRGIVALRINFPFQSASMSSFQPNPAGPFEPTIGTPHLADDSSVTVDESSSVDLPGDVTSAPLSDGQNYAGTYGGRYGLGAQGALGRQVRPYRRLISAQAIFRRELFASPAEIPEIP